MKTISDVIEQFLKNTIDISNNGEIELQRSTLAEHFECVPSQINYVINTRFSLDKGFVVESKRGGGGYIRIKKLLINSDETFYGLISNTIGDEISHNTAVSILNRLLEENYIVKREYNLIKAIISRETININIPNRDIIRSNILKTSLKIIFSQQ
ncbi:MAG: CtsR family transcriptional regulator [Vulcanibacillus sp.]